MNEMTPVEIRDFYDRNGNMTLLDLSCETGLTVPELKKILLEEDLWFMPHGGTLDIPAAKNAKEAEKIVNEILEQDPRIGLANPITLVEKRGA